MTTILEALKDDDSNVVIYNVDCRLYYDCIYSEYVVLQHKYRARHTTELYRGPDEHAAVAALLGEENDTK